MANFTRVKPEFKDKILETFTKNKDEVPAYMKSVGFTETQIQAVMAATIPAELKILLGITSGAPVTLKSAPVASVPSNVVTRKDALELAVESIKDMCSKVALLAPAAKLATLKTLHFSDEALKILKMTFDPAVTFGIEPSLVLKTYSANLVTPVPYSKWLTILENLANRSLTGNAAIEVCQGCYKTDPFFNKILGKNLEIRLGAASLNKVWPGFIPVFKVQLIQTWTAGMKPPVEAPRWFLDRKLDGERTLVFWDKGEITIKNRAGSLVPTLESFRDMLKTKMLAADPVFFNNSRFVIDGEVVLMENGVESFQALEKEIRRVDHQIENAKLVAFDLIPLDDFNAGASLTPQSTFYARRQALDMVVAKVNDPLLLEATQILWSGPTFPSDEIVIECCKTITSIGGEGCVLKADLPYIGDRTYQMLRVKPVTCEDFKVVNILYNDMMIPGKTEKMNVCSAIEVDLGNGKICSVGSGFSWAQRVAIKNHPELILGKIAEVQYSIRTNDGSLRFPVIRAFYEEANNDRGVPITIA